MEYIKVIEIEYETVLEMKYGTVIEMEYRKVPEMVGGMVIELELCYGIINDMWDGNSDGTIFQY